MKQIMAGSALALALITGLIAAGTASSRAQGTASNGTQAAATAATQPVVKQQQAAEPSDGDGETNDDGQK